MKAVINGIEFEGTVQEMMDLVNANTGKRPVHHKVHKVYESTAQALEDKASLPVIAPKQRKRYKHGQLDGIFKQVAYLVKFRHMNESKAFRSLKGYSMGAHYRKLYNEFLNRTDSNPLAITRRHRNKSEWVEIYEKARPDINKGYTIRQAIVNQIGWCDTKRHKLFKIWLDKEANGLAAQDGLKNAIYKQVNNG